MRGPMRAGSGMRRRSGSRRGGRSRRGRTGQRGPAPVLRVSREQAGRANEWIKGKRPRKGRFPSSLWGCGRCVGGPLFVGGLPPCGLLLGPRGVARARVRGGDAREGANRLRTARHRVELRRVAVVGDRAGELLLELGKQRGRCAEVADVVPRSKKRVGL